MTNSGELSLLRTKLERPRYQEKLVPRPHLLQRLDAGLRSPLILLSAPAGFGKSTLLSAWLEQCPAPSAWLALDVGDNDLVVFLRYVIAAVRTLFPDACAETEALTRLALRPSVTVFAHELSNELDALPGDFVLVLDDYDVIHDAAVYELLSQLLQRPPWPLHLVLAARQDPALPLVKLRATGRLTELRLHDLRFTPAESAAFFTQVSGLALDQQSTAALDSVLEGWPAGLRLATLSLRTPTDVEAAIAGVANSHGSVMDYLFDEIFTNLPPSRQADLLKIAVLDRFCASLCVTVCEQIEGSADPSAGQSFVTWLQAANLFVVPLDDQGGWFRFHHLFLQLLRYRQQAQFDSAALAALHGRAAAWFAGAGLVEDALRHALAAGDLGLAAAVVAQVRQAVLNQEDWPRLQRWLDLFPAEFVAQTPELSIIRAWVLHNQFRSAEVDSLLDEIEAILAVRAATSAVVEPDPLEGDVACLRAMCCFWRGEGERCLLLTRRVLEVAPRTYTMVRGSALLYLGVAAQLAGEEAAGFARLQDEFSLASGRNAAMEARILIGLTVMEWVACDLSATTRMAERLLKLGEQHRLVASWAWGHYYLGCVHYARNDLAQAATHFGAIVDRPFGAHALTVVQSHFGLALARYAHFTSPIRRYSDLLVHRALISGYGFGADGLAPETAATFESIGQHISATERRAAAAEREAIDRYVAHFMAERVGEIFPGRVSGVAKFGLFVALQETGADGLLPIGLLPNDFYDHDDRRHALVGRRWGRVFELGAPIVVKLAAAQPLTGGLTFEYVEGGTADAAGGESRSQGRSDGASSGMGRGPGRMSGRGFPGKKSAGPRGATGGKPSKKLKKQKKDRKKRPRR